MVLAAIGIESTVIEITVQRSQYREAQGVVITVVIGIELTVIEIATDWGSL